jgi:predicted DNA-binding transcriptional regulator AlpA
MVTASTSSDVLMDTRDLAAYLNVSIPTIYDWIYKAKHGDHVGPPVHRAGTRLRFRKSEVDAWLAREQESTPK